MRTTAVRTIFGLFNRLLYQPARPVDTAVSESTLQEDHTQDVAQLLRTNIDQVNHIGRLFQSIPSRVVVMSRGPRTDSPFSSRLSLVVIQYEK